jgi:hypothetical protein
MRKTYLFLMVLAGLAMGLPGCSMGSGIGSALIDGGISLALTLIMAAVTGSFNTPAA